jgi:hypothetical protein
MSRRAWHRRRDLKFDDTPTAQHHALAAALGDAVGNVARSGLLVLSMVAIGLLCFRMGQWLGVW